MKHQPCSPPFPQMSQLSLHFSLFSSKFFCFVKNFLPISVRLDCPLTFYTWLKQTFYLQSPRKCRSLLLYREGCELRCLVGCTMCWARNILSQTYILSKFCYMLTGSYKVIIACRALSVTLASANQNLKQIFEGWGKELFSLFSTNHYQIMLLICGDKVKNGVLI